MVEQFYIMNSWVIAGLCSAYAAIFIVGVTGNLLVVFVLLTRIVAGKYLIDLVKENDFISN